MAVALKSWKALGTSVHVLSTHHDALEAATTAVRDVLEDVDEAYSRFRNDSELTRLNANAGRTIRISPLLATAIDAALRAARLTDGAVDPTIGRAIRVAGYDDDFSRIAAEGGPVNLRAWQVPGWQGIRLDRRLRTICLPRGIELDLGSTGKALAADLAATAAMAAVGRGGLLVSLGGDIAIAGEPPSGRWQILVAEDSRVRPDGDGDVICVPAGGVAASSTTVRRWSRGGAMFHHIIDPQTSLPASGPFSNRYGGGRHVPRRQHRLDCGDCERRGGDRLVDQLSPAGRLVEDDGTIHYIGRWPDPASLAA